MNSFKKLMLFYTLCGVMLFTLVYTQNIPQKKKQQTVKTKVIIPKKVIVKDNIDSVYVAALMHLMYFEGFRSTVYVAPEGKKTIGYGHQVLEGESFSSISMEEATKLLKKDMKVRINYVKTRYNVKGRTAIALALFSFNCGIGTVNKLMKKDVLKYPKFILNYCHYKACDTAGNTHWVTSSQLLKRREYELALLTNKI